MEISQYEAPRAQQSAQREARCRSMRPCVKKAALGDYGDRKSGQVWRGNTDLTLHRAAAGQGPRADR